MGGIPANEMNQLRMNMPEDVTIKVCKNSLVKIATLGEGFERFAAIAGEEKDIIGGAFDGTVLDAKGVDAISKLPTKQELMQSTAVAIKQTSVKLARVLKQAGAAQRIAKGVKEAQGSKLARAVNAMSTKLGDN